MGGRPFAQPVGIGDARVGGRVDDVAAVPTVHLILGSLPAQVAGWVDLRVALVNSAVRPEPASGSRLQDTSTRVVVVSAEFVEVFGEYMRADAELDAPPPSVLARRLVEQGRA